MLVDAFVFNLFVSDKFFNCNTFYSSFPIRADDSFLDKLILKWIRLRLIFLYFSSPSCFLILFLSLSHPVSRSSLRQKNKKKKNLQLFIYCTKVQTMLISTLELHKLFSNSFKVEKKVNCNFRIKGGAINFLNPKLIFRREIGRKISTQCFKITIT